VSKAAKVVVMLLGGGCLVLAFFIAAGMWRVGPGGNRSDKRSALEAGRDAGKLIIFHAGSLAVPFKQICQEFNEYCPGVKIVCEAAGSRMCARKISDLDRRCDVMASADYTVIDKLLIPEHAEWNIKFASNEMVIAFRSDWRRASEINRDNWCDILLQEDVAFGRSDPNADPCGYRAVLTIKLAEKYYGRPGFAGRMLAKDQKYIRPKEVDLLALLEVGELDCIFIYRSVAEQHGLRYVVLDDEINLKNAELADTYRSASVRVTGKEPGTFITKFGEPIIYGVTIPNNAPDAALALVFVRFLLDADKGGAILERNGQTFVVPAATETFDKLPKCLKAFALPSKAEG
jgi:molybdate/tungstate transport system substrate-binding protein